MAKRSIDKVAKDMELLQLYENQKVHILNEIMDRLRSLQAANDKKGMKWEMDVLRNILGREDAVVVEQINTFKGNDRLNQKFAEQRTLIIQITRLAVFYKNNDDMEILNVTYNKIFEGIQRFKVLSAQITDIKNLNLMAA